MRRQHHDTNAAHRKEQPHYQPRTRANVEPIKRAYERIVAGEVIFPDELIDEPALADTTEPEVAAEIPVEPRHQTAAELEREVDQTLAWRTGSGETKYGSLKKPE